MVRKIKVSYDVDSLEIERPVNRKNARLMEYGSSKTTYEGTKYETDIFKLFKNFQYEERKN